MSTNSLITLPDRSNFDNFVKNLEDPKTHTVIELDRFLEVAGKSGVCYLLHRGVLKGHVKIKAQYSIFKGRKKRTRVFCVHVTPPFVAMEKTIRDERYGFPDIISPFKIADLKG